MCFTYTARNYYIYIWVVFVLKFIGCFSDKIDRRPKTVSVNVKQTLIRYAKDAFNSVALFCL